MRVLSVLLAAGACFGQFVPTVFNSVVPATPGFVSASASNSTTGTSVGSNPTGQTACPTFSYCLQASYPALSGNLRVVPFQYAHASTSVTATAADDKSNSFTVLSGSQDPSGTNLWNGIAYAPNVTAGAIKTNVTFGTTAVSNASAQVWEFYNIATSSPVDVDTSCSHAATTSANCASITTTAANDLVLAQVCPASSQVQASITFPGGWTQGPSNLQDDCAVGWTVATSAGVQNPTITLGTSSSYTEFLIAFKSASAGTAPSGVYVSRMLGYSEPNSSSATSFKVQFPNASGSLLTDTNSCISAGPTAITDAGRTWTTTFNGSVGGLNEYYLANAAATSPGDLTFTVATSQDCTFVLREYVNAPTSVTAGRASFSSGSSGATSLAFDAVSSGPTWSPLPSVGISEAVGSEGTNTAIALTAPSGTGSNCQFDAGSFGGEPIDGPQPLWQNNPFGHCIPSAGTIGPPFTFTLSASGSTGWTGDVVGFWGSGGIGIIDGESDQATSGSSLNFALTKASIQNNLMAVEIAQQSGSAAISTSSVCLSSGGSCITGGTMSKAAGATAATGHMTPSIWFVSAPSTAASQIHIVFSGAVTNAELTIYQVAKGSGSSWSQDGSGGATNAGTCSGTTCTGPSVTTTGTNDFCLAGFGVNGSLTTAPASGNSFSYAHTIYGNTQDGSVALITTTAGSKTPVVTDGTSGDTFYAANACFN